MTSGEGLGDGGREARISSSNFSIHSRTSDRSARLNRSTASMTLSIGSAGFELPPTADDCCFAGTGDDVVLLLPADEHEDGDGVSRVTGSAMFNLPPTVNRCCSSNGRSVVITLAVAIKLGG